MQNLSQQAVALVTGDRANGASEASAAAELAELGITHAQLRAVPVSQVSGGNRDVCHGFLPRGGRSGFRTICPPSSGCAESAVSGILASVPGRSRRGPAMACPSRGAGRLA